MKNNISISSLFLLILFVGASVSAYSLWKDVKSLKDENARLLRAGVRTANIIVEKYIDRVDTVEHTVFADRLVTRSDLKKGQVPIDKGLLDTMVMALKMADGREDQFNKKIKDLTRIKGKLEGVVQGLKGDLDQGVVVDFSSKYLNARVDTTYKMIYRYDAELRIALYDERGGFLGLGKPKYYVDISSPDTNFTINHVDRFRVDVPVKRNRWGVGAIAGWGVGNTKQDGEFNFRPIIGFGVSFDLIRF